MDADTVRVVWSVDESTGHGLLDLLPAGAGKLAALEFLRQSLGLAPDRTMFAGESGNDLEVLASSLPTVLVANASDDVRRQAVAQSEAAGTRGRLYLARGGPSA